MEILKKTILQAVTTGTTATGGTVITGDTTAVYYVKFGLKQVARDTGFFDAYIEFVPPIPPIPPEPPLVTFYLLDDDDERLTDNNSSNIFIYE